MDMIQLHTQEGPRVRHIGYDGAPLIEAMMSISVVAVSVKGSVGSWTLSHSGPDRPIQSRLQVTRPFRTGVLCQRYKDKEPQALVSALLEEPE